jgi:hypothetical protein
MKFMVDYSRLILFSLGLLIGVQLPAVVDQYSKRVDAHLSEARQSLAGFQHTADRYFSGSLEHLINHYANSDDKVFRNDAGNIQLIYQRVKILTEELKQLNRSSLLSTYHVVFAADKALMNETMEQYGYSLLINPQALIWGISIAFAWALLVELLLRLMISLALKAVLKITLAIKQHRGFR